ncbi:DUF1904 family protein [Spiroplasma turonicum]|uniref:DUF1904 domain-containing protein n=1 Tax=Spiroplasma turonicum TaxID=216946 RepID=A0A0K1P4P5_9MOLU|nr:DUF1904 family protein [Spiroplasma turonicum]AKU79261.1 hypothetical protein STURON_0015 [Spiroplasma turonicum]ALX70284.1 hypothetical protein STURO_v1c00150 [Spiroplasma turonicum]
MPIFTFRGENLDKVKEYHNKIGELALLVNAKVENFVFMFEPINLITNERDFNVLYVTVEWLGRPLKQEVVANHLQEFFGKHYSRIYLKFTEINNFMYLNGSLIG